MSPENLSGGPADVACQALAEGTVGRRFLSITELAAATGFSVSTLRRLQQKGVLPFYQPGGPRTRLVFPADAIERCVEAGSACLPTPLPPSEQPAARQRGPKPKWMNQR
jgi:excisionase family DNA binding protein